MVNGISSERKVEKNFGHPIEYTEGPLGDVLGTSRINLPGTSLKRQIRTSSRRHFRTSPGRLIGTSPGRQIRTSPGRSNRIFRGPPGDVGGGRPRGVLGANICRLGFLVKEKQSELKRYEALLTYLVSRAVYIEVVATMETDSFIMALRRMIARRGNIRSMRSDNGTNFVGT